MNARFSRSADAADTPCLETPLASATPRLGPALLAVLLGAVAGHAATSGIAWGNNNDGQTVVPAGLTNAVAVAGGGIHSLALRQTGRVVAWGNNAAGQTNAPLDLTNAVTIAAGYLRNLAIRADGRMASWGYEAALPAGVSNQIVSAIAVGAEHSLALRPDGTVLTWGLGAEAPEDLTNVVAIAAGNAFSLALKGDGTVVAWGSNASGVTSVPAGLKNVAAVAAGEHHAIALLSDGRPVVWGDDGHGQANPPARATNGIAVSAGAGHCLLLRANGTVVAWGRNDFNQATEPGTATSVVGISCGLYHNVALRGDGTPFITVPPASQFPIAGKDAIFRVMAAGAAPLAYQWRRDGTNLPGATTSVLTLPQVREVDAGLYAVTVANTFGSVESAPARLTPVNTAPFIVTPPQDTNTLCNESASFRVTADGTPPFSYQWLHNGAPIAGATRTVLNLTRVLVSHAGQYAAVVTNAYGAVTSAPATLTVIVEPPLITSPLTASGKQGVPFLYTIRGLHTPTSFSAVGLPGGLSVNSTNGVISGIPAESGVFTVVIGAANACATDNQFLTLSIGSSVPVITSPLTASGVEGQPFSYQITATELPTGFGAEGLPLGLSVDPAGQISGAPVYAGSATVTIWASNAWGVGSATLQLSFTNMTITGLAIANVTYSYTAPYLLDFTFSLRDTEDPTTGSAVVVPPRLLSVRCLEDQQPVSPSETAVIVARGNAKQLKAYLVLDFTASIASMSSGDTNENGISDAVDQMVRAAKDFVRQQPADAQIGVYEFHREDYEPQKVIGLTTDKTALELAIDSIWETYVEWFPAGSRCWDALELAINEFGVANPDEQRYIICLSDGRDESSLAYTTNLISLALTNDVKLYCVGYGAELDYSTLTNLATETHGRYYSATNAADLAAQFAQVGRDLAGQYVLRWATLKRSANPFMPSFEVSYQGFTALSPTNPIIVDTNIPPGETNPPPPVTNIIIAPYTPTEHAGNVTIGSLRLVPNAEEWPSSLRLRAMYVPRYIRRLLLHYRPNWPCTATLESTGEGEILRGWSLTETNDGAGGRWLELLSPNPLSITSSIPYAAFGNLVTFRLRDMTDGATAFSSCEVDNSIYLRTGGQSFVLENTNDFSTVFPPLPYGTPVPWLIAHGFTNNWEQAELDDPDADGAPTWMEYAANTDPRDPASVFAIRSVAPTGPFGHYQITLSTAANRRYRVEWSEDLATWQTLVTDLAGINADLIVTDMRNLALVPIMYYRAAVY